MLEDSLTRAVVEVRNKGSCRRLSYYGCVGRAVLAFEGLHSKGCVRKLLPNGCGRRAVSKDFLSRGVAKRSLEV